MASTGRPGQGTMTDQLRQDRSVNEDQRQLQSQSRTTMSGQTRQDCLTGYSIIGSIYSKKKLLKTLQYWAVRAISAWLDIEESNAGIGIPASMISIRYRDKKKKCRAASAKSGTGPVTASLHFFIPVPD